MSACGNIVLRHSDGTRTYLHTPRGGREIGLALADALLDGQPSEALAACVLRRLAPLGGGRASEGRMTPDVDELHVDVATGEIVQVTLDIVSGRHAAMHEREVARWTSDAFLELAADLELQPRARRPARVSAARASGSR